VRGNSHPARYENVSVASLKFENRHMHFTLVIHISCAVQESGSYDHILHVVSTRIKCIALFENIKGG